MDTLIPSIRTLQHEILRFVRELHLRQVLVCALLVCVASSSRGHAEIPGVKEASKQEETRSGKSPKSLARWHAGAALILVKEGKLQRVRIPDVGFFEESVFLSDNSALTHSMAKGKYNYIIDLGKVCRFSRFSLNNQTASGKFRLYAANELKGPDSRSWKPLTKSINFQSGTIPAVRFDEAEARFIMIEFKIIESGEIGNFGLTGLSGAFPAVLADSEALAQI